MSLKGKVKWFNGKKGYGFIEREDKEKDVFVHASAVREAGLKFLNEGDELTFEVEDGEKGPAAVKLQKNLLILIQVFCIGVLQLIAALFLYLICCILKKNVKKSHD